MPYGGPVNAPLTTLRPSAAVGVVLLAGAGVLWGGAGAAGRMLSTTGGFSPVWVAAARALVGGLGLLALGLALRRPWPAGPRAWRHVAAMAVLTVGYQACYFAAIAAGSLSLAALVALGSVPVFVTVLEGLRYRRLSAAGAGILALALVGLALLTGGPGGGGAVLGVVVPALGAGLSFALITLINTEPIPGADTLTLTGVAFLAGGSVLLAAALAVGGLPALSAPPAAVAWLAVLGLACTAAPYGLYFTGLPATSASLGALFTLLEPLVATLIAVVAFGERLTALGSLGAALLLGSVVVAGLRGPEPTN